MTRQLLYARRLRGIIGLSSFFKLLGGNQSNENVAKQMI